MSDVQVDLRRYDPMEWSTQQDPFPWYAALHREAPIYKHQPTGMFFVSRLDIVLKVLADTGTFSSRFSNQATSSASPEVAAQLRELAKEGFGPPTETMLTLDPPAQTRYRKTVGKAFSTRRILALERRIREICDQLIGAWPEEGRVDFVNGFAVPYPVLVIAYALNMEPERGDDIKRWSDDSVAALGVQITDERRIEAARGVLDMQKYWAAKFEDRRAHPQGDFLTDLVNEDFEDEEEGVRKLRIPELTSIIQQLMVAGNETTTKLINELMKLLIENPDQWEKIRADASLIPGAVEEALRMSSPNQGLFRLVTKDVELEGVKIPEGSSLWVMFGAANRDASIFPDPHRFDPTRDNLREHVAFGRGAHFCIGAPLARLETKVFLEQLTKRVDRIAFAPDTRFEYEPSYILRGLKNLEIEVRRTS
jgi:cytochrome P450